MKKTIALFFCTLIYFLGSSQPVANALLPQVDPRVELLNIAFTLAHFTDVNDSFNPAYAKAIHDHFDRYSEHPLIKHLRTMMDSLQRDSIEFGYWDIAGIAVHLNDPPRLDPIVPLSEGSPDGWDTRSYLRPKLITLLQQFYADANCKRFFQSQNRYYESVRHQYQKVGVLLNKEWLQSFFALETTENYYAIVGLTMREGAYLRVNFENNRRNTVTVFGCTAFDGYGLPTTFSNPMFPRSMLHEYVHAFTNQLVDRHSAELQKAAETLLANPQVFKLMENTFYGNWQFLLYESLVRASSIRYLMANKNLPSNVDQEIAVQEKAGFLWMRGLVDELGVYESNRKKYKNLEAFMPEVTRYFNMAAAEMK